MMSHNIRGSTLFQEFLVSSVGIVLFFFSALASLCLVAHPVGVWIVELVAQGLRPQLETLEVVDTPSHTYLRELGWLLHFWQKGAILYNYETVVPHPTMQILMQQYSRDLLYEEPGADIWEILLWAAREDAYYDPRWKSSALPFDYLPPTEHQDMHQARHKRFTIEAWTPCREFCMNEWFRYRALEQFPKENATVSKKLEKGINHWQDATLSGFLTDENVCPILKKI
ncbi:hypothetical protein [Ktedonobacter racemifer]|uniref:Uncharacterized protein n=1 Tax=Ktedonobacter racemifer DSM 44963 TaxID=485913 RepID=D6U1N0_KTERA|nr:hypothetical protein [Ktedonobacter racemifer]EFH82674.1 hypothetical protein Krac_3510 [Ktedonobacter racemifer DSM 44963]